MKMVVFLEKLIITCILVCCMQVVTAQNLNIRGRIYDEDRRLIPGAVICIQQRALSNRDGFFNFKDTQDSLTLSVQWIGYLPYEKRLSKTYEGDLDIYIESNPELNKQIVRTGPPYGIKGGYLFNKNGEPISGAAITSKGNRTPTRNDISRNDGFFETKDEGSKYYADGYTELSILVDGHKPFEYTFQSTGKKSSWIEHDGLFIVLTFY